MPKKKQEELLDTLEAIKRLLILQLLNQGVSQQAICDTIQVSKATVTRMVPQKNLKKSNS